MMDRILNIVRAEYENGDIDYIGAITALEKAGYSSLDAELIVSDWETND
jgi:hypothetical protein